MLDKSLPLLLQVITDSGLYNLRTATILVRRIAKHTEVQKEMADLQNEIAVELEARKLADGPSE